MTLTELLVAAALGLLIALAATTTLQASRQGFTAVDAAAQLRDSGRFLQALIQRQAEQTGYQDLRHAIDTDPKPQASSANPVPDSNIFGLNNAWRSSDDMTWEQGDDRAASADPEASIGYGSDILVLRNQTGSATTDATESDATMTDCAGFAATSVPETSNDSRVVSILHVALVDGGEPTLMCSRSADGNPPYQTTPLIVGVENFQVLYGVDGIGPDNQSVSIPESDGVPERYLHAGQLTIAGNANATHANWRRVRSIRVGVVLRGPPGSAIDKSTRSHAGNGAGHDDNHFYPLGIAKDSATGVPGSAFAGAGDPGSFHNLLLPDNRLRLVMTFTVHLRNIQHVY